MDQGYKEDILEEEVPEINRAEMRLAEAIGALDLAINELDKRLERVLRPDVVDVNFTNTEARLMEVRPATTQLTDFLNAQAARVETEHSRISDILRRLGL